MKFLRFQGIYKANAFPKKFKNVRTITQFYSIGKYFVANIDEIFKIANKFKINIVDFARYLFSEFLLNLLLCFCFVINHHFL